MIAYKTVLGTYFRIMSKHLVLFAGIFIFAYTHTHTHLRTIIEKPQISNVQVGHKLFSL